MKRKRGRKESYRVIGREVVVEAVEIGTVEATKRAAGKSSERALEEARQEGA